MKKTTAAGILALTLAAVSLTPAVTAGAKEPGIQPGSVTFNQDSFGNGKFSLNLEYDAVVKPTYTIKVPQSLVMEKEGTDVYVEASNVENLAENGKYISVKVRDTWAYYFPKAYRDDEHKFNLYHGYEFMSYTVQPKNEDGTYGDALTDFGQELLSFTGDGTKYYRVTPGDDNTLTGKYWGAINFQIELADLPAE